MLCPSKVFTPSVLPAERIRQMSTEWIERVEELGSEGCSEGKPQMEEMMTERKLSHLALSNNGFLFDSATGHTYSLNETGTFILKKLIEGLSLKEIGTAMTATYDISRKILSKDLDQFFHFLCELGIIEKESGLEKGK